MRGDSCRLCSFLADQKVKEQLNKRRLCWLKAFSVHSLQATLREKVSSKAKLDSTLD